MFGYIYKITNLINGKIYVGKTEETIERRFYEHKLSVKTGKKQSKLYSAMKSYGVDNFIVDELDTAQSREELCEKEKYWISKLKSQDPDIGYNVSAGGDGGATWDQKGSMTVFKDGVYKRIHRDLINDFLANGWVKQSKKQGKRDKSNRSTGIWINNGTNQKRIIESELQLYLSLGWSKGYSDTAKRNLSISHRGHSPSNKGVQCKEETKKKISDKIKGSKWMNNGIKSLQVKKDEIEVYLNNNYKFGRLKKKIGGDNNE